MKVQKPRGVRVRCGYQKRCKTPAAGAGLYRGFRLGRIARRHRTPAERRCGEDLVHRTNTGEHGRRSRPVGPKDFTPRSCEGIAEPRPPLRFGGSDDSGCRSLLGDQNECLGDISKRMAEAADAIRKRRSPFSGSGSIKRSRRVVRADSLAPGGSPDQAWRTFLLCRSAVRRDAGRRSARPGPRLCLPPCFHGGCLVAAVGGKICPADRKTFTREIGCSNHSRTARLLRPGMISLSFLKGSCTRQDAIRRRVATTAGGGLDRRIHRSQLRPLRFPDRPSEMSEDLAMRGGSAERAGNGRERHRPSKEAGSHPSYCVSKGGRFLLLQALPDHRKAVEDLFFRAGARWGGVGKRKLSGEVARLLEPRRRPLRNRARPYGPRCSFSCSRSMTGLTERVSIPRSHARKAPPRRVNHASPIIRDYRAGTIWPA